MVFIIAGTSVLDRNTVGRLLAETLAWEFVDAENLRVPENVDADRGGTSRAHADRTWDAKTLSAAINLWIYEWRDVVVSCPVLTEGERRQLSGMSSLVKIVFLKEFHAPDRTRISARSVGVSISRVNDVSTLDLYRPVEEIIADLTAVLTRPRRGHRESQHAQPLSGPEEPSRRAKIAS